MNPIATVAKALRIQARRRAIKKLSDQSRRANAMDDLKEVIHHAVMRAIHKGGNRRGESRVIELPAIALIADDITSQVIDVIAMYTHNNGGE